MDELNDLELTLLKGLTTKYPSIHFHIPHLKVASRKSTGVGMFVNFVYENFKGNPEDINILFSNEENITVKELNHGLGYVIDITDGEIMYIEFFTDGEKWNGKFTDYKIIQHS